MHKFRQMLVKRVDVVSIIKGKLVDVVSIIKGKLVDVVSIIKGNMLTFFMVLLSTNLMRGIWSTSLYM